MTEKMPTGHGGYRPGAGRKPGSKPAEPSATRQSSLDEYNQARAKKERHLAELAEIEVAVKRGELLPADAVQLHWEMMAANTRGKLLSLPGRLAASVMGVSTIQEAERQAMALIREALEELAAGGIPHE